MVAKLSHRVGRFDGHVSSGGLHLRASHLIQPTIRTRYKYETDVTVKKPGRKKSMVEY